MNKYDSLLVYYLGRKIEEGILLGNVHSIFASLFLLILYVFYLFDLPLLAFELTWLAARNGITSSDRLPKGKL